MKTSYINMTVGTYLALAAFATAANAGGYIQQPQQPQQPIGQSSGYIDAGISIGNPFGQGFGYAGGLCGYSCAGSGFSSQYSGLPSRLPQIPVQHRVPVMPNIQGGWVNHGGGGMYPGYPGGGMYPGYPGGGMYPGYPGGGMYPGYPGGGMYPGYPGGGMYPGYPGGQGGCGFNPCARNNFYPPVQAPLPSMMVPGGPISGGGGIYAGGGATIIDMRSPAEWERNDTAGIIWGVSAGLSSMTSNVYPVAFPRQEMTIPPPVAHFQGPRDTGFSPRPGLNGGAHGGGSMFQ